MPVLRSIRERLADERPLEGITVAACLHVTAETANLVRALVAGGAEVALCAANPLSTQDETAAALAEDFGAEVHARRGEDAEAYAAHVGGVRAPAPARHPRRRRRPRDAPAPRSRAACASGSSAAPRRRPPACCACARSRPRGG